MTSTDDVSQFGSLLRSLRAQHGYSLRDLGERIRFHRGYVGKVEQGEKFPDRQFAELADDSLNANGALKLAWDTEHERRKAISQTGRILTTSLTDALRLIESEASQTEISDLYAAGVDLAVAYLGNPPGPMLVDSVAVRTQLLNRLGSSNYRHGEQADLYLTLGRVQGVLAYAALDLGDSEAAMTHARAAWICAERADSNELRAWVRGTESLISRFDSRYLEAQALVLDGLRYPVRGTGRLRLLSGLAQCRANLGDSVGANAALNEADAERLALNTTDEVEGLFGFSQAKQFYYAGSSLMWLPGKSDLERSAREAELAISIWSKEPPETRSLDDEALAHIYAATAHLKLGDIDASRESLVPILMLPEDRRISWILKRLRGVADQVDELYPRVAEAMDLSDEIRQVSG